MIYNIWLKIDEFKRYHAFCEELLKMQERLLLRAKEEIKYMQASSRLGNYQGIAEQIGDDLATILEKRSEEIWNRHGSPIVNLVEYGFFREGLPLM